MSRLLAELLGAKEPDFSLMVRRLESISGQPSADIRLATELISRNEQKLRHMQLDAKDTKGPELYHALLQVVQKHDRLLTSALNGSVAGDDDALLKQIKAVIKDLSIPKTCWAIKPASLKQLLQSQPPKNVMKHLGYRSVDSILKREKCPEILSAALFLESPAWRQRLLAKYKVLKPSDFEKRDIDIILLPVTKWGEAAQEYAVTRRSNLLCAPEVGVIGILPLPHRQLQGLVISLLPNIIYGMHQIRIFSIHAKMGQLKPDFGKLIAKASLGEVDESVEIAGSTIPWPVLQRHFGSDASHDAIQLFEPHVQPEDLHWHSPSAVVVSFNSELEFWQDTEYLGVKYPDGVISYNLLDAAVNYCNNVPYHKRIVYYMRESLWHELLARYLRQPHVEQHVLRQMEANWAA